MDGARRTTLGAASMVVICFFLPWMQVSCLGRKDSMSGLDLAREGDHTLWLVPLSMLLILLLGSWRLIRDRIPALFALISIVGGGLSAWLIYRTRLNTGNSSSLIATFWTVWFWLSFVGSLVAAAAAIMFYARRARAP